MVRVLMNPSYTEHQIMKFTSCTLEEAREVEPLMRALLNGKKSVIDMPLLRFEALAIECETATFLRKGGSEG